MSHVKCYARAMLVLGTLMLATFVWSFGSDFGDYLFAVYIVGVGAGLQLLNVDRNHTEPDYIVPPAARPQPRKP